MRIEPLGRLSQRLGQVLLGILVLAGLSRGSAAAQAADSTLPYAVLLQQYREGRTEPAFLRTLARRARTSRDTATAAKASAEYLAAAPTVFTPEHLRFVGEFTRRSTDPTFALLYQDGPRVDQALGEPGYASSAVDDVITREEIDPLVFPGGRSVTEEPDWAALTATIAEKYDPTYADRTVGRARVSWNWIKGRWPEFRKHLLAMATKYGIAATKVHVNNAAWDFFLHSTDPVELTAAATWMAGEVKRAPEDHTWIDTYANLLYKAGRVAEAVAWQERAVALATAKKVRDLQLYQDTLAKMRRGEPTWPTE